MSNKVQDFIELWKEKRSFKALMTSDISAHDPDDLRRELLEMDPVQRSEAKKALEDVSKILVKRIERLKEKREKLNEKIKRSKKTKKACLAYQKQEQMSSDYKEKASESRAHKRTKIQDRLQENIQTIKKDTEE